MRDIQLLRPHTHAGVLSQAGAVLTVDAVTADWLLAQRVGVAVAPTFDTPPAERAMRRGKPSAPHEAATDTTGDDHEH